MGFTKKITIITIGFLLVQACNRNQTMIDKSDIGPEIKVTSPTVKSLINQFIDKHKPYRKRPFIIYARIVTTEENNRIKLHLRTIEDTLILKKLNLDGYCIQKKMIVCFDFNTSKYIQFRQKVNLRKLICVSGYDKPYPQQKEYTNFLPFHWLALIENDTIKKINRHAHDVLGRRCRNCLEWGGFVNSDGKVWYEEYGD